MREAVMHLAVYRGAPEPAKRAMTVWHNVAPERAACYSLCPTVSTQSVATRLEHRLQMSIAHFLSVAESVHGAHWLPVVFDEKSEHTHAQT